ncbi:MAG TPA: peptidylprolyl isomerase, partial [Clostridiales bacterium]|nr:peptidylprolyl isomerase [Clostridiales bacterium]
MAKHDERSKAEIYRAERKARLAKAAKSRAKRASATQKIQKIVQTVIAAVLVIAITFFAVWNFFGANALVEKASTVMTVGSSKVSARDFRYYYILMYNYTANQALQYQKQYGQNILGFETGIAPDEQKYPQASEDSPIKTWADYLSKAALDRAQQNEALYKEAIKTDKAKYSLTDEEKEDLNKQIEELRKSAAKQSFALNAYLKKTYGVGITEKFLRTQLEKEAIVERFNKDKLQEFKDAWTLDKIKPVYEEARDDYDVASVRVYTLKPEKLEAKDGETKEQLEQRQKDENAATKAKAEGILATVSDDASFVNAVKENKVLKEGEKFDADEATMQFNKSKAAITSKANKDAGEWVFAKDRAAGDKKVFQDEDGDCYLVFVKTTKAPPIKVDVRHILLSFKEDAKESSEPTAEEKANAKAKAEKVLEKWQAGDKTEESFAALAKTDSTDPGSKDEGGLYKDVKVGSMVAPFENWCFDPTRKPGDTGIVETTYGYHVMYMVKNDADNYQYIDDIRENKSNEDIEKYVE